MISLEKKKKKHQTEGASISLLENGKGPPSERTPVCPECFCDFLPLLSQFCPRPVWPGDTDFQAVLVSGKAACRLVSVSIMEMPAECGVMQMDVLKEK